MTAIKHGLWGLLVLGMISLGVYLFLVMPNLFRHQEVEKWSQFDFAHRGLFNNEENIPENSLTAFQKAIDEGYGIELDVQLTKDLVPVVVHDDNLKRVCNVDANVSDLTAHELFDYPLFNANETVPTLDQALMLIGGQVPVMVEIKVDGAQEFQAICEKTAEILEDYQGDCSVISFNPYVLQWFRKNQPEILRGQLSKNFTEEDANLSPTIRFLLTHLLTNFLSRPDFISYNYEDLGNTSVSLCKTIFNTPIALWTIANEETYQSFSNQFDMMVFDGFIPQI